MKVGDKVEIIKKIESWRDSWGGYYKWVSTMDGTIGKKGVIREVKGQNTFLVYVKFHGRWNYHKDSLKLHRELKFKAIYDF